MITEDYVSWETGKLMGENGFDQDYPSAYYEHRIIDGVYIAPVPCTTLQMAVKWLRKTHNILLIVDYDYECTDTSYFYKIYRLGEHGKPERVAVKGVSYAGADGHPVEHTVCYRDYERSYKDYKNPEEACDEGIRYCLENLV